MATNIEGNEMKIDVKQEDKFFWYNRRKEKFVKTDGKSVEIPQFFGFDFFRYTNPEGYKCIAEGKSGFAISAPCKTYKEAIESALQKLDMYTNNSIKKLNEYIDSNCKTHGISPRYSEKMVLNKNERENK